MAMKLTSAELDRQRLPPIDLTPRTFLEQPQSFTRPGSRVSPLPPTVREERPHRSLKKVARGHREWSRGLCECTEDKRECILSIFCPCVLMWQMAKLLDESCCVICFPGSLVAMRTKTRALGGIKGSVTRDWLAMCCCPCFALAQTANEVDLMALQTDKYIKPVPP